MVIMVLISCVNIAISMIIMKHIMNLQIFLYHPDTQKCFCLITKWEGPEMIMTAGRVTDQAGRLPLVISEIITGFIFSGLKINTILR